MLPPGVLRILFQIFITMAMKRRKLESSRLIVIEYILPFIGSKVLELC